MIPFQTVLALILMYLLVGCSQLAPPGSNWQRKTGGLSSTNTNTGGTGGTGSGTTVPAGPVGTTPETFNRWTSSYFLEKPDGARTYVWHFSGEDAKPLYQVMAVEASASKDDAATLVKTGTRYFCEKSQSGKYHCAVKFNAADGVVEVLAETPKPAPAEREITGTAPKNDVIGPWTVTLHPVKEKSYLGQIIIGGKNALDIYQSLNVSVTSSATGNMKTGKNLFCNETKQKDKDGKDMKDQDGKEILSYLCTFYLFYNVADIQIFNAQ